MEMHTVYRFETDDRRGCFAAGAARVRRTPEGWNVHNPGAYGDPMHSDPRRTLHEMGSDEDSDAYHFGFFDLRQMRHWFGDPEIITAMYGKDGYWHKGTPLRRYEVPLTHIHRAQHQVTFDSRKATLLRTYSLSAALTLLTRGKIPPADRCVLCPQDNAYETYGA